MEDREKIIEEGLEHCTNNVNRDCITCPYSSGVYYCVENLCSDALTLIKEQQKEIEDLKSKNKKLIEEKRW